MKNSHIINKICLIGNSSFGTDVFDGQRLKVRLYYSILIKEGFDVHHIDLSLFKRNPLSTLCKIKKECKKCDCIILLTASKGAELLIPFINKINKRFKKRFILPLIGTSVLHRALDHLDDNKKQRFLINKEYNLVKKRNRMARQLKMIDLILPETEIISEAFRNYYDIQNVLTLTNFREDINPGDFRRSRYVFASRISRMKGVFILFEALDILKKKGISINVDLYGPYQLSNSDKQLFDSYLSKNANVKYKGTINPLDVVHTLSSYCAFLFPTLYLTEGVPGVLVESLIAGTPIISSSFPQYANILVSGCDSLIFELGNANDLASKIQMFAASENATFFSDNALNNGKKYLYSYNRHFFLECVTGKIGAERKEK